MSSTNQNLLEENQAEQHQDEQEQTEEAAADDNTSAVEETGAKQPLQQEWSLWFHLPQGKSTEKNYSSFMKEVYTFGFVCPYYFF